MAPRGSLSAVSDIGREFNIADSPAPPLRPPAPSAPNSSGIHSLSANVSLPGKRSQTRHLPGRRSSDRPARSAERGPVLVSVDRIRDADYAAFIHAIHQLRAVGMPDGAIRWGVFRDTAAPEKFRGGIGARISLRAGANDQIGPRDSRSGPLVSSRRGVRPFSSSGLALAHRRPGEHCLHSRMGLLPDAIDYRPASAGTPGRINVRGVGDPQSGTSTRWRL